MPWHNYGEIRKDSNQSSKFLTSISFKTSDRNPLVKYLRSAGRAGWVSPEKDGFVCVFDELCDGESIPEIDKLSTLVTKQLNCSAVALIRSDYSLIWYQLYNKGQIVGENRPATEAADDIGLLPPHPAETSMATELFGIESQSELKAVRTAEELFDLITLPIIAQCLSFNHIERDEFELEFEDLARDDLEISLDEACSYDTLTKLGWTKIKAARAQVRTNQPDEVLQWPGFVAGITPRNTQDADAFLSNGIEQLSECKFEAAIADFDRVLDLKECFPEAYYARHNRAVAKFRLGDTKGAIDDLLVAVKLHADCDSTKAFLTKLLTSE